LGLQVVSTRGSRVLKNAGERAKGNIIILIGLDLKHADRATARLREDHGIISPFIAAPHHTLQGVMPLVIQPSRMPSVALLHDQAAMPLATSRPGPCPSSRAARGFPRCLTPGGGDLPERRWGPTFPRSSPYGWTVLAPFCRPRRHDGKRSH
jgi:hypothetical protein